MQTTNAAYKQAVAQAERTPVAEAWVDWLRTGTKAPVKVASVRVDRSIVSDLPDDVMLISGHSVAQADLELTGDPTTGGATAGALYSPYQTAALRDIDPEGLDVAVKLGITAAGQDPLTVFAGQIRELAVDAASDGTNAYVQAFDASEGMRFTPSLPLVVADDPVSGLQPGLNSQYFVDGILRQAGYYASPPVRQGGPNSFAFSATMHGSAAIDPRWQGGTSLISAGTASGGPIQFQPCKFGLGTKPDAVDGSAGTAQYAPLVLNYSTGYALVIEMWIVPAVSSYSLGDISIRNYANTADSRIRIGNDGSNYFVRFADAVDVIGPAVTASTQPHYMGVFIEFSTLQVTWRIDGATTGPVVASSNPLTSGFGILYNCLVKTFNSIEALQITDAYPGAPPGGWNDAFVPTATVESGLNDLIATPQISADATAWTILQDIAQAEAALVLFDEPGRAQFWNRHHWGTASAANTVQRILAATTALKTVTVSRTSDRVRNVIRVPIAPVGVQAVSVLWSLAPNDFIRLPPRTSADRVIDLSPSQVYQVDNTAGVMPSGGPLVNGHSGYRAAKTKAGATEVINLTMQVTADGAQIRVSWYNPNTYDVWLVTPTVGYPAGSIGLPTAAVVGRLITTTTTAPDTGVAVPASQDIVEESWQPSIDVRGSRVLSLPDSAWRQTDAAGRSLAADTLRATAWPKPQLSRVTIVGDPALQLGDRVRILDDSAPSQTGIDEPAWVVAKTDRFTGGDLPLFEQDLVLQLVARPRQLILGVVGRSELGGTSSRL